MKKKEECCGNCNDFKNENIEGFGWCKFHAKNYVCGYYCNNYNPIQSQPTDSLEEKAEQLLKPFRLYLCPDTLNVPVNKVTYDGALKSMIQIAQSPESLQYWLQSIDWDKLREKFKNEYLKISSGVFGVHNIFEWFKEELKQNKL